MFDPHRFYSPHEVQAGSHAPRELVYSALERGDLRALRRGRRWLIPGGAVLEWIASLGQTEVAELEAFVARESNGDGGDVRRD